MDSSGPKTGAMASNGSARSPGRSGSRGRGGSFRGDRGGRGRGNFRGGMRGGGNFRGGDRSVSRGRGKFLGNNRGSVRGSFQGNQSGSVRGSFRGGDRGSVRGRGNFRGGDKSPFRGRGRGSFRGGDRGQRGRGGSTQRKRKSSESEQGGSDSEQEGIASEQEGSDSNDNNKVIGKTGTSSKDSEAKAKKPVQSKKSKKKIIGDKRWGGEVPDKTLLPGQPVRAVKISNLPSPFPQLDKELKKLAETVGSVELLTYNRFKHPKGCIITAICVFEDKEHVSMAVEKLHGHEFHGNHLLVQKLADDIRLNDNSVCVSNLSEQTTEEDLWKFFGDCGSICMIEMRRECNKLAPEALHLARIYFNDSDSVDRATALSNSQFLGSTIEVFALNSDLIVYAKNFETQNQYETIKEFMSDVNAVYYCFIKVRSPVKMRGLLFFLLDEESYNKVASLENFSTFPLKKEKMIGCLNYGNKKKVSINDGQTLKTSRNASREEEDSDKNDSDGADEQEEVAMVSKEKSKKKKTKKMKVAEVLSVVSNNDGQTLITNQNAPGEEENSDMNDSDGADEQEEVAMVSKEKSKKKKTKRKVAEVLSEEPTDAKKKKPSAAQKRKGDKASDTSSIKKKKES